VVGTEWLDIIFFVERVAAAKNSKNREAGTMELHAINATKETYFAAWIKSLISAIQAMIQGNCRDQRDQGRC
jgi:hypothetical protein